MSLGRANVQQNDMALVQFQMGNWFVLPVRGFRIGQWGTRLFGDIGVFIGADPRVGMYGDFGFVGNMR